MRHKDYLQDFVDNDLNHIHVHAANVWKKTLTNFYILIKRVNLIIYMVFMQSLNSNLFILPILVNKKQKFPWCKSPKTIVPYELLTIFEIVFNLSLAWLHFPDCLTIYRSRTWIWDPPIRLALVDL